MEITRITMKMEELQKLVCDYEGTQMVTIEVVRIKEPGTFGRTHTAYAKVEVPEAEEKPKKKNQPQEISGLTFKLKEKP